MLNRARMMQIVWILAAVGLLAAAGAVQPGLDAQSQQYKLKAPGVLENHPAKALLTMAPGGLRAIVVNYLWIRAEELKNNGRHYEAMQLADMICRLQPNFAGVWAFHAWNMAYNISVATHTPEERWLWVSNGVRLLRDEGIPQNRNALLLYKELGWIFYNKMAGYLDDMHATYKQRWAAQMHRLLASPPFGTTAETLEAFRPIAQAPLDKDLRRQGRQVVQADQLALVLADPKVAEYARMLAELGVGIDQGLLDAYNRFSRDDAVEVARPALERPRPSSDRDKALSAVINDPAHARGRTKLTAFVRAQVLWNVYKMDPDWMMQLMVKYGPLDWRLCEPHALYWVTYGLHVCEAKELGDVDSLNTDRIVLFSLQSLTFNGRLAYVENPQDPNSPRLTFSSDWRFIDPAQREMIMMANVSAKANEKEFKDNLFRSGHVNYLAHAIQMLYAGYRRNKAQELFDWIKKNYQPEGPEWPLELEDFVFYRLNKDGRPIPRVAISQISAALQSAFLQRAAGDTRGYRESLRYALRVYNVFQKGATDRTRLPPFNILVRDTLANMLVQPRIIGVNLLLLARANLYARLDASTQRSVYDLVAEPLARQSDAAGIDFDKAFPPPPGLQNYRSRQLSQPE